MDWQRGKIPFFVQPPNKDGFKEEIENQNEKVRVRY